MLNTIEQISKQVEKSEQILLVFSSDWNGDEVSSALALFLHLKQIGKNVNIAAADSIKKNIWSFLPAYEEIKNSIDNLRKFIVSLNISQAKVDQIKYTVEDQTLNFIITPEDGWFTADDVSTSASGFQYDLIICLGASDLESLGLIYDTNVEFFYKTPIVNIDCQSNNEEFGQINLVDVNSLSISEVVFNLIKSNHSQIITEDIATCLLSGIISKTKNFKSVKMTPDTLLASSKLIKLGARREEIINKLYRSRDFKTLKLWGKILSNLNSELNGRLIWSIIKKDDFKETAATQDHLVDIIDELIINIPEAKIIVIIFENQNNDKAQALLYSAKNINALDILKEYHPHGTPKISEIDFQEKIDEAAESLIKKIKIKLNNLQ